MNRSRHTWMTTAALACAVAGLAGTARGQSAPGPEPTTQPLLWRIDGVRSSYLYGTVHVADRRVLAMPESVLKAIESSRTVYTEIPMDKATRRLNRRDLLLPEGQTLQAVLPQDLRDRLDRYLQSKGFSLSRFDQLKPWAVTVQATMLEQSAAATDGKPLDRFIVDLATAQGKRLDALETMHEQIGVFESLSIEEHLDWLRATLDRLEADQARGINASEQLIELYLAGDPEAIFNHLIDSFPGDGELGKKLTARLFEQRNLLMCKRMTDKLRTDPARGHFFAVGAGHLGGKQGLLALLRNEGFRLKRIALANADSETDRRTPREIELEAVVETLREEVRQLKERIRELEKKG